MDEETQKELVSLAKQALVALASSPVRRKNEGLLFALRDIIRKIEGKDGKPV